VEFKPGMANVVADTLSHRDMKEARAMALSCPSFQLFNTMHQELDATPDLRTLWDEATMHEE
jgi:hypothetical protein